MKEYEVTKIWADEIASISSRIDSCIDSYKESVESYKDSEQNHEQQWCEEYKQRILCAEWVLAQINIPMKFKK